MKTEKSRRKIIFVNVLLMVSIVLHFFIAYGVFKWIQTAEPNYYIQILLMALPVIGGICVPCLIYELIFKPKDRGSLAFKGDENEKPNVKSKIMLVVYVVLFACLTYFAVCYMNFAVRGIVQYFTKNIAVKQLVYTGGAAGIILSLIFLAILPALAGEYLNKKIVTQAYSQTGAVFSFILPVLFSAVFYTDVQTIIFRICYGCASMLVYRKTNNFWLSALFIFIVLTPDVISGGGVWLPLDYRTTLSLNESLMNGLFALSVSLFVLVGWCILYKFVFSYNCKRELKTVKPDYFEGLSIILVPVVCIIIYLLNFLLF